MTHVRNFILFLICVMIVLPGCALKKKPGELPTYQACPQPTILRQLSRHKTFSQDPTPQLQVMWTLERVAKTSCEVRRFGSHLEASVRLSVTKGPAFPAGRKTVDVPYFMAVQDTTGRIIEKTTRVVTLTFDTADESYAALTDTIAITGLTISTDKEFDALSFIVGLQAEPQE